MNLDRSFLAIAVALMLAFGMLGLTQVDDFLALDAASRASWAQALGSIGAIVAAAAIAIWVDRREVRRQRDERMADRVELLQVLCDLADDATAAAEGARDTLMDLQFVAHNGLPEASVLAEIATLLEQLDVRSLKSAHAHRSWLRLIGLCRAASVYESQGVADWRSDGNMNPDTAEALDEWPIRLTKLRDQLFEMRDAVRLGRAIPSSP